MPRKNEKTKKRDGAEPIQPFDLEAEMAVLGAIVIDANACMPDALEQLKRPEAFYDVRNQLVFEAMIRLSESGRPIDLLIVSSELKLSGMLVQAGGLEYLVQLEPNCPGVALVEHHIAIVREHYFRRRIFETCAAAARKIKEPEITASQAMDFAESEILSLSADRSGSKCIEIREVMKRSIDAMEEYSRGHGQLRGISTGFDYFDKMCCGFQGGQLIVIAARPGMGKTSIGMQFVEFAAVEKKIGVAVFSLEMTAEELGGRLIFQRADADFQRFRTGYFEGDDIPKVMKSAGQIANSPIFLDDNADMNVTDLRASARRLVRQKDVKMVLVDYLQLIRGNNRYSNRESEVADISRGLKTLAKELNVPVIVLAQLNRDLEKDKNRVPRLSDLRESGSIEQDADLVGMLYEPKLDETEEERYGDWSAKEKRVNLLVAKQRNGPTGKFEMTFKKSSMRFFPYLRTHSVHGNMPTKKELGLE